MRVARSRWFSVVIATMVWSNVWSGGVLAQDTAIPFRPACELVTTDAVSAVLGVDVTPADAMPDAWCSYLHGAEASRRCRSQSEPSARAPSDRLVRCDGRDRGRTARAEQSWRRE